MREVMRGIDISHWQGTGVDFGKVRKAGKDFVMLRCSTWNRNGLCKDPAFERNYKAAKAAGLHVGAYTYTYAANTSEALMEAQFVCKLLADKQLDMGVWFDMEYEEVILRLTNSQRTAIVAAFLSAMENAGHYCGLYASSDFINNKLNYKELRRFDVWAAQYGPACGSRLPFALWQTHGGPVVRNGQTVWPGGTCAGVPGWCDQDVCYKDLPAIIKGAGLCGYRKGDSSHPAEDGETEQQKEPEQGRESGASVQLYDLEIGPMTGGDKVTLENMAHALGIPVKEKKI